MLILPDDGQVDAEMLRDMVKEVNATQVAPAERLTNDVYHFDTKDHVFEKADRFTERQKEKEAQVAKTEKVGKEQPDQKPKTKKHDMELLSLIHIFNLMEGYGNDNPGAKSQGIKQLMSGGGVILIGTQLIPLLSGLDVYKRQEVHSFI